MNNEYITCTIQFSTENISEETKQGIIESATNYVMLDLDYKIDRYLASKSGIPFEEYCLNRNPGVTPGVRIYEVN